MQIAIPASQVTSGTFANDLISETSVTQHTAALAIDASQVTSGTFAAELISETSVTQHSAALSIEESQITDGTLLARCGNDETVTGNWIFTTPVTVTTPTDGSHAATKAYVDSFAGGLAVHASVKAATISELPATYDNGASGIGATLTSTDELPSIIDGVAPSIGDRVLVKDQTDTAQNGIYIVTQNENPWIFTRASDFDASSVSELAPGVATFVEQGSQTSTQWVLTTVGPISVGSTALQFTQFGGPGTYSAGAGITIAGTSIANDGVISITAGAGIEASASSGSITLSNLGILQVVGTEDQIVVTESQGTATLSLSNSITLTGTITAGTFSGSGSGLTSIPDSATSATAAPDVSTIVARDSNGDFAAGIITASLSGNASTATALSTGREISVSGDASGNSPAFDGTGAVDIPLTLATVNFAPQANAFVKITVNEKGLVTETAPVESADINALIGTNPFSPSGGITSGGPITIENTAQISVAALVSETTDADQVVASFSAADYRSARFQVQMSTDTAYSAAEISLIHDGSTVFISEWGTVNTAGALATFSADISGGLVRLLVSPISAPLTIKVVQTAITI